MRNRVVLLASSLLGACGGGSGGGGGSTTAPSVTIGSPSRLIAPFWLTTTSGSGVSSTGARSSNLNPGFGACSTALADGVEDTAAASALRRRDAHCDGSSDGRLIAK